MKHIAALIIIVSTFLVSCGPGIGYRKNVYKSENEKDWTQYSAQGFFYQHKDYKIVIHFNDNIIFNYTFFFLIFPLGAIYEDKLTLFFLIEKNEEELPVRLINLPDDFAVINVDSLIVTKKGTQFFDDFVTNYFDTDDITNEQFFFSFKNIEVFNEEKKKKELISLPNLNLFIRPKIQTGFGIVGHYQETPFGWIGIIITILIYGTIIRLIFKAVRK